MVARYLVNLLLVGATAPAAAQNGGALQAAAQPPNSASEAITTRPMPQRPDATMAMRLPGAISDRDLARYAAFLSLSAPQKLLLDDAYKRYREAISRVILENYAALDELNAQACALLDPTTGISYALVRATGAFYDKEEDVLRRIIAADTGLFAELKGFLSEPQLEGLQRVLNHRARQRCCALAGRVIRSSKVDLSAYVEDAVLDADALGALDPLLVEYERSLTPLTVELEHEMRSQDRTLLELQAWRERDADDQRIPMEQRPARSLASLDRQESVLDRGVQLQVQIAALNRKTLPLLLANLAPDRAAAMQRRYRTMVYPAVYHIELNGIQLCDKLVAIEALTEAQREAVTAICQTYRTAYDETCAKMEKECDQWQEFFARVRFTMDKYAPYQASMRKLRRKRWDLGLTLARQISSVVPPGTLPEIDDLLGDFQQRTARAIAESQDPSDRYPGM